MKRSRKSNRVSWAPPSYLCQVKLFLSDDCPSKVGLASQDHLQAKTSPILPSSANECNDLPPGFEGYHFLNQPSSAELAHIPIDWKCPPQFTFSPQWRLAAGEESKEKADQKLREMKVLEAVYPRISAIPPSPAVSFDVTSEDYDDSLTPVVPLIPIEEEESVDINPQMEAAELMDASTILQPPNLQQPILASSPIGSQVNASSAIPASGPQPSPGILPAAEPDLVAASALVAAALVKSTEQGNPIDVDLLVKIFKDPAMVEKLVRQHVAAADIPTTGLTTADVSVPLSKATASTGFAPAPKQAIPSVPTLNKPATPSVPLSTATASAGFAPAPKQAIPSVPTLNKPATPSVPLSAATASAGFAPAPKQAIPSVPTLNKPATPSVPLSVPLSGKSATSPVTMPIPPTTPSPPPTSAPHVHKSKNIHPPQHDIILSSGVKRAAPFPPVSSSELRVAPFPSVPSGDLSVPSFSVGTNFHAGANSMERTPVTTLPNQQATIAAASAFSVKDANYYKNLIRQHGADRQEVQDSLIGINHHNNFPDLKPVHNNNYINQREAIYKNQKPCIYFKSPRGCRNGANCPYQHDVANQWGSGNVLVAQNGKRMKLGPEIKGRS